MDKIVLTEEDADEFLESIGVELYNDHMAIGEFTVSGIEGQNILEENGIFLYENCIMLDEINAKEYLDKKQKEYDKKKADAKHDDEMAKARLDRIENNSYVDRNPAFDKGRKIAEYRRKYGAVMPNKKTSSEKTLSKAKTREQIIDGEANISARNYSSRYGNDKLSDADKARAISSIRHRLRKDVKSGKMKLWVDESANIFSSIKFI